MWLLVALPLVASLAYGEHDTAGISAIVFIVFITLLILLSVIKRAEKRLSHERNEQDEQAGRSEGTKAGPWMLLPFIFVALGPVLTRLFGHLYLILGVSTFTSWVLYIVVLARARKEDGEDMPVLGLVLLSFNALFMMAVLYAMVLVLVYLGEVDKIRELF